MRSEIHVAVAVLAHFFDELRKRCGVGQIQIGVWFAGVPVAAGDQRFVELPAERGDLTILFPGTQSIGFEGMDPAAVGVKQAQQGLTVLLFANCVFIPARVVEHNEDAGVGVQ